MQILKQLWSKEIEYTEIRNTYQIYLTVKSTTGIAQDSLGKMSRNYKRHHDRKAGNRELKESDKALILLPTKTSTLLMGWEGR